MGIVSSMFVELVINICWQCRLYLDGNKCVVDDLRSPTTGFLNTPEAASTPLTPEKNASNLTLSLNVTAPGTKLRKRKVSVRPKKSKIQENVYELLSPIEKDLIIMKMAHGYDRVPIATVVPSPLQKSYVPWNSQRDLPVLPLQPSATCMALDLAKPRFDFRTRGIRL